MHMSEGICRDIRGAGVVGCKLPSVSIEKQTWVLCKSTDLFLTSDPFL